MTALKGSPRLFRTVLTFLLIVPAAVFGLTTASSSAATPNELNLKVLLIGSGTGSPSSDPTTAAWESALSTEGVAYTEVDATGTAPAETVTLPTLSSGSIGNFNAVVLADDPADFAANQLSALDTYESTFGVRQLDGNVFPTSSLGVTEVTSGALDGTTGQLTTAGLAAFPSLAGPIPFSTGTYGYGATINASAPFTALIDDAAGDVVAGIYQHPATDPQANVSELALFFNYNASQLQWELLAPDLINWVTNSTHLGEDRNYIEMDIDDTFTPDDSWSIAVHDNDYADADALRMNPSDVSYAADWSQANNFRMDQLFNFGSSVYAQEGGLAFDGSTVDSGVAGPDPLLAAFQATDPSTGKPYADSFGWLSHTYDTPYLDVGCATQNYIEAELNENTSSIAAPPGATPGTGGLGLTESTNTALALGYENPQVFVPGNHSGFADLDPGTPATVDPPDLDSAGIGTVAGSLAAGTYEYAVTDQFTTTGGESQAYVTDPITVAADQSVSLQWEAICHAANYNIYRENTAHAGVWTKIGTYSTPTSATLPDNSSGNPTSVDDVTNGGELELTFNDTGATSGTSGSVTYLDTPATWSTPPVVENAVETPWEQNPYFIPALEAVGITAVGDDASKAYPDPPDDQFGIGTTYTGATYAAGSTFVDGTAQVVPRHPINIFYNASTEAQEVDEYNTLYDADAPDSQCQDSSVTTCSTSPFTFPEIVSSIVSGMFTNILSNSPDPTYVHQTNLIGSPPGCSSPTVCDAAPPATPPSTSDTTGDGLLYSVLNPLLAEYTSYFNANTPYEQLTLGAIGDVLADQTAWSTALGDNQVTATETNGVVTVTNTGTGAINVPVTVPDNTTVNGAAFGTSYGGTLSGWTSLAGSASTVLSENASPTITSAASVSSYTGNAFSFTVTTTGSPTPAITEADALPSGVTFTDNGNGTATLAGTPATGTAGSYPITITAANGVGTNASQSFTLTVTAAVAPTFTSGTTAYFTLNQAGSVAITTTGGMPTPVMSESGTLPAGLTFTDNGNGTATLAGTPTVAATTALTFTAANGASPAATQDFTVVVGDAPAFTSADSAGAAVGSSFSFTVTTSGYPAPSFGYSNVPPGLTFTDNEDGMATLAGTPTTGGTYAMDLSAASAYGTATQTLTVTVGQVPAITSADSATFTTGEAGTFSVTTTGSPNPALTESGPLPSGVSFVDNGDGTATLSGTPATGTADSYPITITAANGISPNATQSFTLTVNAGLSSPVITSAASTSFTVGTPGSFTVTTTGSPTPALSTTASLPSGVTFVDNGNGTATIAGTPASGTNAVYDFSITAANGIGSNATQVFTLTVNPDVVAPVITSAASTTFAAGQAGSFTVTTTGTPTPSLSATSIPALPSGVTFVDNGNGTATLAGTPPAGSQGTYALTITANNSDAVTQSFTLTVNSGLAITSVATTSATAGSAFSFTVTATGTPTPTLTRTGTLPSGVTFKAGTNGTATLSGTPATTDSGPYPLTFTAKNSTGTTSQAFTLTVDQTPSFTSAATVTDTAGTAFTFTVATKGYPTPTLTSGTLPAGVSFSDNGNGTGSLLGTTAVAAGTYSVPISAENAGGTTTQTITLTVKAAGTKEVVPTFTSAASATATAGTKFTFKVTTAAPTTYTTTLTHSGALPSGISFSNNGNGTATLSGTPSSTSGGTYDITFTAKNTAGSTTQSFVLTVSAKPTISTATSATATVGSGFNFTVKATGAPTPALTESGALPQGVTWLDNGNGTATLSGTPGVDQGGVYKLTISASNTGGTGTQSFTLTVDQAPAITSAASATATHGTAFTFTFMSTGYPLPSVTHSGTIKGLSYSNKGNGTGTLSGTPKTAGVYTVTITAKNSVGTATQTFTLTVS